MSANEYTGGGYASGAAPAAAGSTSGPAYGGEAQPLPVAPAQPVQPAMPVAGLSAYQNTIDYNSAVNNDTPTEPMEEYIDNYRNQGSDDHTIGFFDDVFSQAQVKETGTAPGRGNAPVQTVNKVSTPCVGWLVALSGEHIGTDFRLKVGKNFIGRNPQMDVALTEDKSVSRDRHAIVVYEPKAHMYLVQPGESSSLVYCNNQVVLTPVKLEAYDMLTVGDVNLLFIPLCGERFNWGDLLESMKKNK
jgi:hypothetical protein